MFYIYADGELLYYPMNQNRTVLKPKLTLEVGKAGSLSFGLLPSNILYDRLRKLKTVITVEWDSTEIFRGRILSMERAFTNVKTVYCEGNLSFLVDSVQKSEAYTGTTRALFRRIIDVHNARVDADKRFKIGEVTIDDREIILSGQSENEGDSGAIDYQQIAINSIVNEWSNTFDYIQTCLIDYVGGYLRTRKESDGLYIDYVKEYGGTAKQEIEFGVNMLDLTEEVSAEELFTVLVPLGDENLTIASVNGGSDELVDEEAVATYGRIVRTHVFDNVNKPETLLENGRRYMASNVHIPTTFTITAVDMHVINPNMPEIHIGDNVTTRSAPHSLNDAFMCTKIEYDLEDASQTEYTFGNPKQTLTQRYRRDARKQTETAKQNSARGGGGAGKKAEEDAVEEAKEEVYREWIDYDPNNPDAKMSLGALSVLTNKALKTLHTEVGINFDGSNFDNGGGNLNLYAIQKNIDDDKATNDHRYAALDLKVDENKAYAATIAKFAYEVDGKVQENVAKIETTATALGSRIDIVADEVNINAKNITNINSEITKVKNLIAEEIKAVKANIDFAISTGVNTSKLSASNADITNLHVLSTAYIRGLHIGEKAVSSTTIPVVTSFTQASGETAPTMNVTILHTSISAATAHKPLLGDVKTFAAA